MIGHLTSDARHGSPSRPVAVTAAAGPLPSGTETTLYVGGLFEKVTKPAGTTEYKHSILAHGQIVAIRTLRSSGTNDIRYLHPDHLGSVDAITNEAGAAVLKLSYDAFGKRRSPTTWSGSLASGDWTNIAAVTHRIKCRRHFRTLWGHCHEESFGA